MAERIVIDPVTRIEGHAKITIFLNDAGEATDAQFHVTQFRGFEHFCVGRPFWEMPGITSRVCGICPVSHLLASAKAGDGILAVEVPETAVLLRRLINLAQIIQSHSLSFFHLSSPDLLLGMDAPPETRNLFGVMGSHPEWARRGIRLRQYGQEVIEALGGRKIHPTWAVAGGVRSGLTVEARDRLRAKLPEAASAARGSLVDWKRLLDGFQTEVETFGNFPSLFLGHVGPSGEWEHYDGKLRIIDANGAIIADQLDPTCYFEFLGEATESYTYVKSPYYRPLGYPGGMYRVGALARLNISTAFGTPEADAELAEYRHRLGPVVLSSFHYHYARLVEILACLERIAQYLDDPALLGNELMARASVNRRQSVGASEAPRGTLFHHYRVDPDGKLEWVNMIIATGQNNLAMNRTVAEIARRFIRGPKAPEGILNRVEAGIRAYDPCLSCSTHAVGSMPIHLELVGPDGSVLDEVIRG